MRSHIVITQEFEKLQEELEEQIVPQNLRIIAADEIKIEQAKEAIKEAYITSKETKVIALFGRSYNIYAQNALLKVLEEPPKGVVFVLAAKSRSIFLPTILSRLPVKRIKDEASEAIVFEHFDLERLYELAQGAKSMSKTQAKGVIKGMLDYALRHDFSLGAQELEYFDKAVRLLELHSNPANIFITAGLILLTHKKRKK